ncbi:MAG TPA: flagellar biosynthetic protein FliQ [Acetivibrio sp.]|nr:flagellar biosynthetic protein FliQ [Acetivibrio sp.]
MQEQTLTFIPKILAILSGIVIFGAWMLRVLIDFTQNIYLNINQYIR